MDFDFTTLEVDDSPPVAHIWLNRPDRHNAFNATVIEELTHAFIALGINPDVRTIILGGTGRSFSAGADLDWMAQSAELDKEANMEETLKMARMYSSIFRCPKPVIARVHGAALGGGMGLVAACDIAVASERALFGFTEVRLGIAPSVISPFVIYKIGAAAAHRYFLTGERFDAEEAMRIGLVASVQPPEALDTAISKIANELCQGAPDAQAQIKWLIARVADFKPEDFESYTAELIAAMRASDEGQEGLRSFLARSKPPWVEARPAADTVDTEV
ncbi:MAG: enoyl-CoA hydratase/isomerase family protein [bacterium]|jgi:methylglutaconyl-CoA hydratase